MEAHLSVDNLIPLMPSTVREEYLGTGDAHIFGFSPGVKHWLEHSQHPRVERWRDDVKRHAALQVKQALREQEKMAEYAKAAYAEAKGSIRHRAVIHPTIKQWMETTNGADVWKDRASIKDTEKRAPKLFVNH